VAARSFQAFVFIILWLAPGLMPVADAATKVSASVDRTNVAVGDQIALTVEVESDEESVGEPRFTDMSAFDIYSSGRTQSIQWVNGKMSVSVTYNYLMSARTEGTYTIPPANIRAGDVDYPTQSFRITVTPARTRPDEPQTTAQSQEPAPAKPSGDRRIFITAELDRDTAYINEPVTYIFRFYQGERLLSSPEYQRTSFPGFWVEDLPPQRKYSKVIDNVRYEVTEIRYALFPTDAGPKRIGESRLKATVRSAQQDSRRDPFSIFGDDFFGRFDRGEPLNLATAPLTLTVLPLPNAGRPDDFSGLVGNFTLNLEADQRTVTVGDPLTVKVTLEGAGNLKSAQMPKFDSIPDLRTFSAGSAENISTAGYRVSGSKTFDQVFIPQRPGRYRLPSFSISYFDPNARRYRTLTTDSLEITATGSAADFTIPALRLNPDEVSDLAADVRMIRTDSDNLRAFSDPGLLGWPFWAGHAAPFLALVTFLGWRRRTLKIAADPVGQRRRLAYKTAIEQLPVTAGGKATASSLESIAAALLRYYGDRFNRPAHGVLRQDMRCDLTGEGIAEEHVQEYLSLLDECDRGRYGRESAQSIEGVGTRARDVLTRLEGRAK
jgi:hypothetical protein